MFLNQYPVRGIQAIRTGLTPAVQVQFVTPNVQAATIQTTVAGFVLAVTANGATTSTDILFADYPTLGQAADRINNVTGWNATCTDQFRGWASNDLAIYRGTQSARQTTANLSTHFHYWNGIECNMATGKLTGPPTWRGSGQWAYRVTYSAGYDPVPEEVISATIELAAATYRASKVDPNLASESLGGYSYSRSVDKGLKDLSIQANQTLRYYRKPRVPYFTVG